MNNKYRINSIFGVISALLKCNTEYNVRFMCGDEEYKIVTMIEDDATKTVLVDMREISKQQDPADKAYYILDEFRDSPVDALKRFPMEDIVKSIHWALDYIDELEKSAEEGE